MPKLYEWVGLIFFFYSNEHEPIHVHVISVDSSRETIFEFFLFNGRVTDITTRANGDKPMLTGKEKRAALKLLKKYKIEIVEKWINYFVWNRPIRSKKINTTYLP